MTTKETTTMMTSTMTDSQLEVVKLAHTELVQMRRDVRWTDADTSMLDKILSVGRFAMLRESLIRAQRAVAS
jgi:hypothetical protein